MRLFKKEIKFRQDISTMKKNSNLPIKAKFKADKYI